MPAVDLEFIPWVQGSTLSPLWVARSEKFAYVYDAQPAIQAYRGGECLGSYPGSKIYRYPLDGGLPLTWWRVDATYWPQRHISDVAEFLRQVCASGEADLWHEGATSVP